MRKNPFEIKTPENNTAQEIVELFVDVFTDFSKVLEYNHTFLNGPRGSGKSMMFRYMQPDCQMIVKQVKSLDLDYFSIYIPIKLTSINFIDLDRFENHANVILNEHLLTTYTLSKSYKFIVDVLGDDLDVHTESIKSYYNDSFLYHISLLGLNIVDQDKDLSGKTFFLLMSQIIEKMYMECSRYCRELAFQSDVSSVNKYAYPLVDYIDFMLPLFQDLIKLPFLPKDKPLFLLIDDAGYLNKVQTKILNTWVSYRTTKNICLKISTQLDYANYLTTNGKRIDAPHDYSEVNIATIYTSSKNNYKDRITSIVEKRLKYYLKSDIRSEEFFPCDTKQSEEIQDMYQKLYQDNINPEKNYAAGDAARRYAIPDYIKSLKNKRSGSTYSYAGFDNLVNISSGIVRHFLAPAHDMYAKELSTNTSDIMMIRDSIQDEIIKEYSKNFLNKEIEKCEKDYAEDSIRYEISGKLFNLIDSLGGLFHKILMSDCSERRVFSIAITDRPDKELRDVLSMGVQLGFFHEDVIGNKDGTGRNKRYVLSRVLSPYYKLDPTSFAGYQFMSSDVLKLALVNRSRFMSCFDAKFKDKTLDSQKTLFDDLNEEEI